MRLGVATISLHDLDPATAALEIARAGFAGIEWRVEPREQHAAEMPGRHPFLVGHRASIALSIDSAVETAELTRRNRLELIGLGPYVEVGDEETLSLVFDMAVAAAAPQIRLQTPRLDSGTAGYATLFSRTTDFLELVQRKAHASGVSALIEVHHRTICPSASLTYRLLSRFDPEAIGVIYDVGNLVWEGYEDHRIALDLLGPYLRHVHAKNAAYSRAAGGGWHPIWTPLEDGIVDIPGFVRLLEDRGYDGWVSIEDLSLDRSPLATLRHNGNQLREWGLLELVAA